MSTFSSANITDGNLVLKERNHRIKIKYSMHQYSIRLHNLGNWLITRPQSWEWCYYHQSHEEQKAESTQSQVCNVQKFLGCRFPTIKLPATQTTAYQICPLQHSNSTQAIPVCNVLYKYSLLYHTCTKYSVHTVCALAVLYTRPL